MSGAVADLFKAEAGRIDIDLGIVHHFSSGVYAKEMRLPAGHYAVSHAHPYSHLSVLASGRALVETDHGSTEYSGFAVIEIKAGIHHKITALEDVRWLCIHACEETDPEKVDDVILSKE